jgi:hypothetical protein
VCVLVVCVCVCVCVCMDACVSFEFFFNSFFFYGVKVLLYVCVVYTLFLSPSSDLVVYVFLLFFISFIY